MSCCTYWTCSAWRGTFGESRGACCLETALRAGLVDSGGRSFPTPPSPSSDMSVSMAIHIKPLLLLRLFIPSFLFSSSTRYSYQFTLVVQHKTPYTSFKMKFAIVAAALITLVAAGPRDEVPQCALPCLDAAVKASTTCGADDFTCICNNFGKLAGDPNLIGCTTKACGQDGVSTFAPCKPPVHSV